MAQSRHAPLAVLPMYDWPEVADETDRLWNALRDACRRRRLPAPERLSRGGDALQSWLNPGLIVGQTCGLPYMRQLRGRVQMLGSPVYAVHGCAEGDYCSFVIAAKDGPLGSLEAIAEGHRFAFNGVGSQSGFRAMQQCLRGAGRCDAWLEAGLETGSHRGSIRAVAEGRADFAAIDAVSWHLACRHEPAAGAVVRIGATPATPGLPMITGLGHDAEILREAVEEAIAGLGAGTADALRLRGFRRRSDADYGVYATS